MWHWKLTAPAKSLFDFVCPADNAYRGQTVRLGVSVVQICYATAQLALPLKDGLIVRKGPACRVCGCAPQGPYPKYLSTGHLHKNYPSVLTNPETVYLAIGGDDPEITVQQARGFRQELIGSAVQVRDGIAHRQDCASGVDIGVNKGEMWIFGIGVADT